MPPKKSSKPKKKYPVRNPKTRVATANYVCPEGKHAVSYLRKDGVRARKCVWNTASRPAARKPAARKPAARKSTTGVRKKCKGYQTLQPVTFRTKSGKTATRMQCIGQKNPKKQGPQGCKPWQTPRLITYKTKSGKTATRTQCVGRNPADVKNTQRKDCEAWQTPRLITYKTKSGKTATRTQCVGQKNPYVRKNSAAFAKDCTDRGMVSRIVDVRRVRKDGTVSVTQRRVCALTSAARAAQRADSQRRAVQMFGPRQSTATMRAHCKQGFEVQLDARGRRRCMRAGYGKPYVGSTTPSTTSLVAELMNVNAPSPPVASRTRAGKRARIR